MGLKWTRPKPGKEFIDVVGTDDLGDMADLRMVHFEALEAFEMSFWWSTREDMGCCSCCSTFTGMN